VKNFTGPPHPKPSYPPTGRKNPKNKPLKIVKDKGGLCVDLSYIKSLDNMLLCQAMLVKAGKSSALPHFIAIVKELERVHGFRFEILEEE
jgi:hypothetical protein